MGLGLEVVVEAVFEACSEVNCLVTLEPHVGHTKLPALKVLYARGYYFVDAVFVAHEACGGGAWATVILSTVDPVGHFSLMKTFIRGLR